MSFQSFILREVKSVLPPLANLTEAAGMQAYMKGIAPYFGIKTPMRRQVLKEIFKRAPIPTSDELGQTARALWKLQERECQYAATDMLAYFQTLLNKEFVVDHCEYLLTTKSWWDTVDSLGSAVISPLTLRYNLLPVMKRWNKSEDPWLVRAAIQHQKGRKSETDVPLLLKFCHDHADADLFWITKAIGWALRDLARFDRASVTKFLREHPRLSKVAVREALRHA